ncbi:hypothetical protein LIER_15967 [Lithospermum erythrorhizon]|uniref:ADP-ribosyl cyclase/cyclic ADP-ribose hydrolase n=1 Tax=Lithospermum erythrorhizon TaxID=34254 RepID=A0AAV3Q6F8_LITER
MVSKPEEVLFIGLWGMGGIGKTTTARAIYEDCKEEFEGSCFLQDVKESKNKIEILQKDLLSDVLKTKFDGIRDVVTGSCLIQERLQFKKVLIVIDDVDHIQQLNALAKQCDWFGRGSRIIITTRDEHLINDVHIEKYDIHTLPQNEALRLFCLHAFKNDHPHEDFKELSLKVLTYAGGLPLALRVLGDHLYRQHKHYWEGTLSRLKDVPEDEIIAKLQISFDGLNVLQQDIFLDIACFFRGNYKDKVEERLESLGLHPKEGIDVLIQKSLIHISMNESRIEMHDLLQEMGFYIVRKRSNWDVRSFSRLWREDDILKVLFDIKVSSEAQRIYLYGDRILDNDITKTNLGWEVIFRNMNKLCFLEVIGDFFKGNYNVNVSQPFGQLGNTLRWFSWLYYPGQSLPNNFHPMNLVHLHMEHSQIIETPDFSHLPNLEVLNLSCSKRLVYVHPSLGKHTKIKRINLAICQNLEEFPEINGMKSLEILNLSDTKLHSVPEIYKNLDSLSRLDLSGTRITTLPNSIERATSLEILKMVQCEYLVTLPISFLGPRFRKIDISSGSLKYFKENIGGEAASQPNKSRKNLIGCASIGQISGPKIHFWRCKSLEELPEFLLSRIQFLVIDRCATLASWICFNLVDLLDKYQHFCYLKLHQDYEVVPHEFPQAFTEREPMSYMMQKRNQPFMVYIPRRGLPSWFEYQFSGFSVTVFLPPLYEWYPDKLRGFVISGTDVGFGSGSYGACHCPGSSHVLTMYIPIDNDIRRDIDDWNGQNECTLFEIDLNNYVCRHWGFSLVYNQGEGNEVDPHQLTIVTNDIPDSCGITFRVKVAGSRAELEELNMDDYKGKDHSDNPILLASLQQQSHLQEGEPSSVSDYEDALSWDGEEAWNGDSELDLSLS